MQGVKTYILILLTFLVVRKSLEDDADYTDFPSPPSTDWAKANPDRTTFPLVFPPKTTKSDDYDDYQGDAGYSSEQPRIVLAQGVYVMIMIPGYNDCGLFNVYEDKIKDETRKNCTPTPHPHYFWVYEFEPDEYHVMHVVDQAGIKLFDSGFTSLPSAPPEIQNTNLDSGAGWISVKVNVRTEADPNLVGVEVLYKRKDDHFWWSSYVESVTYATDTPSVVPVHYCPEYLDDGTYCLLLSDGVWLKNEKERSVEYSFKISSFRIGPLERTFSPPTDAVHAYAYCDWLEMNCNPPMGQTDEYDDYEEYDEAYFANQTTPATKPPPPKKVAGKGEGADETTIKAGENASTDSSTTTTQIPLLDLSSTWAPEMWLENATEPKPDVLIDNTELWLIAVAVLIILVSLLIPLAFWLGTRSGYNEAERYWSELSSTGGNVNISLGYVGTEWTRPVNAPK